MQEIQARFEANAATQGATGPTGLGNNEEAAKEPITNGQDMNVNEADVDMADVSGARNSMEPIHAIFSPATLAQADGMSIQLDLDGIKLDGEIEEKIQVRQIIDLTADEDDEQAPAREIIDLTAEDELITEDTHNSNLSDILEEDQEMVDSPADSDSESDLSSSPSDFEIPEYDKKDGDYEPDSAPKLVPGMVRWSDRIANRSRQANLRA